MRRSSSESAFGVVLVCDPSSLLDSRREFAEQLADGLLSLDIPTRIVCVAEVRRQPAQTLDLGIPWRKPLPTVVHICHQEAVTVGDALAGHPVLVTCHGAEPTSHLSDEARLGVARAAHVVCTSEVGRASLLADVPRTPEQTHVVYPMIGPEFSPQADPAPSERATFWLRQARTYIAVIPPGGSGSCGTLMHERWLRPVQLDPKGPPPPVRAVIHAPEHDGSTRQVTRHTVDGRVVEFPAATRAERAALLASARLAVIPTGTDYAGQALVEAMASGTRVVAGHAPLLREYGGLAPSYVEPEKGQRFDAAIDAVLREAEADSVWRLGAGFRQSAKFLPLEVVREYARLYGAMRREERTEG